jgi:LemA protein
MSILLFALMVVIAIVFISIYNGIINNKNNVIRSWSDVATYQRQKVKLLPDLERLTQEYLSHEKQLLTGVAALRSAIARVSPGKIDIDALLDVEEKTQSVLTGFRAVAEAYPDLRSADIIRDLMAEMIELEENIAAAITIFNRSVADFNSGIEVFPNSAVNAFGTRLNAYPAFRDSEAESGIEYKFR